MIDPQPSWTRRDLLRGLAALPAVPWIRRLSADRSNERALIVVWLDGGMSHVDTLDGKPDASPDIRGDLVTRPSRSLDGAMVSEHFVKLDPLLKRCALVRSITHGEGNHDRGTHFLLTGHRPSPVLVYPSIGSTAALRVPTTGTPLPGYVCVPDAPQYGGSGFLDPTLAPFEIGADPSRPGFGVANLTPRPGRERALRWLEELDGLDRAASVGQPASERARDRFLEQARALSSDPEARSVFDLELESPEQRARYGRHRLGQSCLLARRLVQNGTRVVLVRDRGWDHHNDIRSALSRGFAPKLPHLDQALSGMIEDLDRSGLSERVTVVLASEFGRTPRLNASGGRDHWPRAQSVLLFGAGVKRGVVFGQTDPRGEEPIADAVSPADFAATLQALLGIRGQDELQTEDGRPIPLVERGGRPIRAVMSS